MNSLLRRAKKEDAPSFIDIKNQLPITRTDGTTTTGGFLLGTDLKTYEQYIETCFCLVAEVNHQIVGFGIIFDDKMLRQSDIWQRRGVAQWSIDLKQYESGRLCYFEQLAFLEGHKRLVIQLAYNLVKWAFEKNHSVLFTTTVNKPITNLAAVPFIHAVAGIKAGNIDEVYPSVGPINSDIYIIKREEFYEKMASSVLASYLMLHTFTFHD